MKKHNIILESNVEPKDKNVLWLQGNKLKKFGKTGWEDITEGGVVTTDRIENGAVTTDKIATNAFDSTLSKSEKIAPANIVGNKITMLDEKVDALALGKFYGYFPDSTSFPTDVSIPGYAYVRLDNSYKIWNFSGESWSDSGVSIDENDVIITTDRIADGAVTSEKIATSAFDSTLSVSGKIAPADVVGMKLTDLEVKIEGTGSNYVYGIVVNNLGQEVEQAGWNVSEYIELIPKEDVIWHFGEMNAVAKIVTYTADKKRINSFSANDVSGVRTLSSSSTEFINAKYIRASFADSVKESNVVEMGSYSWKPIENAGGIIYELDRKENTSNRKSDFNNPNNTTYPTTKAVVEYFAENSVPQELVTRVSSIETILNGDSTKSNYIKGKVVTQSGDVTQSGWNATDFIELIPNTDVVWRFGERNSVARLVTYREDKTVISSFGANVVGGVKTMAYTSSEFLGCRYIRASFDDSVKNENIVVMGNYVWKAIDGQKEDGLISEVNAIKTKVNPVIPPIGSYAVWEPSYVTDDYKLPIGQGTQGGADFPLTYYGFLNEYFDKYVNQVYSDGYSVKKFGLGDDSSHTGYELYYYEFAPKAYNHTVLLSSGMNACELSGYFGIAYFIKALMEEQEQGMIALKNSTRFVILPCMCPSCVDARPISYLNANGVRVNKNFNYKTSWKNISASVGKGTYPDSEIETRLLKKWINKYNGADLWMDCHSDAGSTSGYENTLAMFFCSQDFADFFTYQKFYAYKDFYIAKGYFADRTSATVGVSTNNMLTQYPKTLYAKEVCGIPSAMMEQFICSTTYGSDGRTNNDTFGIKHYVTTLRYIILLWLNK